nr:MAG: hypothetical protein DIU78_19930 [Pseudomonadota bacterium]
MAIDEDLRRCRELLRPVGPGRRGTSVAYPGADGVDLAIALGARAVMTRAERNFEAEKAALEAQLATERAHAASGLRSLHEEWARALLGVGTKGNVAAVMRRAATAGADRERAAEAAAHLAEAAKWQAEIASFATSGAEGVAAMTEVRGLELARAWLLTLDPSARARRAAKKICDTIARDPNGVPSALRPHLAALNAVLAER